MKYIDKLRNSGLRPTKQRLQICEVLFNTERTFHFTINELEQKIKDKILQIESFTSKSIVVNFKVNNIDVLGLMDDENYYYVNFYYYFVFLVA